MEDYNNSVLSCATEGTPDPFLVATHGKYKLTFTARTRVEIWSFDSLVDIDQHAERHVVWTPSKDTDYSALIWAPELHSLQGRWYIYVACANETLGNKSHRMYVLGGPTSDIDPCKGPWEFLGQIKGMPTLQWAIDGTVFTIDDEMYFVYSGWPLYNPTGAPTLQQLWIVKLQTPTEAASQPVMMCEPEHAWERSGEFGVNEGPEWLEDPAGSWRGLAYSCAGCWTKHYKMNTLRYLGGDPLQPSSWQKSTKPLMQIAETGRPPYGPGHGAWMDLGGEMVGMFHATDRPEDRGPLRKAKLQRVIFTKDGPYMGEHLGDVASSVDEFVGKSDVNKGLRGLFHAPPYDS